jgi:hypothetical protein
MLTPSRKRSAADDPFPIASRPVASVPIRLSRTSTMTENAFSLNRPSIETPGPTFPEIVLPVTVTRVWAVAVAPAMRTPVD